MSMISVDNLNPSTVQVPDDADQVACILKRASEEKHGVVPLGGGTMLDLGAPLQRADVVVSLEKLNRVIDYQPANLTVRAEAGITLGALNQILAEHGQFLPLDPPFPDRATLGGILAANASGALRIRYGTARDIVIGIRVALADGQIVKGGGQVVKNVAGYDVAKLFIGSLGTLGIIVEATFKVAPLPNKTGTIVAAFDSVENACVVAARLLQSPLLPMGALVLNHNICAQIGIDAIHALVARFGGLQSAVERQVKDVARWSRDNGSIAMHQIEEDDAMWVRLRDIVFEKEIVVKFSVLPTQLSHVCRLLQATNYIYAANAVGIVYAGFEASEDTVNALRTWRAAIKPMRGNVTIQRAPRSLRERVNVWGESRTDFRVMQDLKREFDSNGILNPGRFVDRL